MKEIAARRNRLSPGLKEPCDLLEISQINSVDVHELHPLTSRQQGIWLDQIASPDSPFYNIGMAIHIEGALDVALLGRSIARVVEQHDVLRLMLVQGTAGALQKIVSSVESPLRCVDLSMHSDADSRAWKHMLETFSAPFPLYESLLWDMQWIRVSGSQGYWFCRFHHLVADGTAASLVGNAVVEAYNQPAIDRRVDEDASGRANYVDFLVEDEKYRQSTRYAEDREFWFARFGELPAPLFPRSPLTGQSGACEQLVWPIDRNRFGNFTQLAESMGCSSTHLLMGLMACCLSQGHGELDEIVIGVPVHGRVNPQQKRTVGMFSSVIPLRVRVDRLRTLADLAKDIQTEFKRCYRHQRFPIVELSRKLLQVGGGRRQLFDLTLSDLNFDGDCDLNGVRCSVHPLHSGFERVPLAIYVRNFGKDSAVAVEFNFAPDVLSRKEVETLVQRLNRLMQHAISRPQTLLSELPFLDEAERTLVLRAFNATMSTPPGEALVHRLFEHQAARRPEAIALRFDGGHLSYRDLNARANRLARHLLRLGVQPNARVAICLERGPQLGIAVLAVLKAGGAYVPLDPAYPPERLSYMLNDSEPVVLLSQAGLMDDISRPSACRLVVLHASPDPDDPAADLVVLGRQAECNLTAIDVDVTSSDLAYVIYTSGSTGLPKGVMVEHRSLCNLAEAQRQRFQIGPSSRVLQFASPSFDSFTWELVSALFHGGSLYISSSRVPLTGVELGALVDKEAITHLTLPPAVLASMPTQIAMATVHTLITAGEACRGELVRRWAKGRQMFNGYGPTEITICATLHECQAEDAGDPPIGRPIANTQIYLLDSFRQPVSVGAVGEIYIGGAGVARGYLNRPELTSERFLPDPFSTRNGARMYRSGDLGRWRADGSIEFVGRNDSQVKIRGYRVELGEIESRLTCLDGVHEAAVMARELGGGDKCLVAYVVARRLAVNDAAVGLALKPIALRSALARVLPEFMLPVAFVELPHLPLTPNGKIDYKALPAPEPGSFARRAYEAPVGAVEQRLASIWSELLSVEQVSRHDNFFELGGHSLLAVSMMTQLAEAGLCADVRSVFGSTCLCELASKLVPIEATASSILVPIRASGLRKPLFLIHETSGQVVAYERLSHFLDPDLPIYGVQMDRKGMLADTACEALAKSYVQAIRTVQPRGPYRLAGWSLGGLIAYEMARQLIDGGEVVAFVGLIDSRANLGERPGVDMAFDSHPMSPHRNGFLDGSVESSATDALTDLEEIQRAVKQCHEAGWIREQVSFEDLESLAASTVPALAKAAMRYRPGAISVNVHLFTADVPQGHDPSYGWSTVVGPHLRVKPIGGTHWTIMKEPLVERLAGALSRVLVAVDLHAAPPRTRSHDIEALSK